jgi:hypothetical protein
MARLLVLGLKEQKINIKAEKVLRNKGDKNKQLIAFN